MVEISCSVDSGVVISVLHQVRCGVGSLEVSGSGETVFVKLLVKVYV